MKAFFLPAGLLLSALVAGVVPSWGASLQQLGLIPWAIVVIFLINGYQTQLSALPKNHHFASALLAASLIILGFAPFLGALLAGLLGFSGIMALGLVVKATVPSTLSTSIVMTQLAGGNPLWALVMTVITNAVGVFSIPLLLSLTLTDAGSFQLDPWALLLQLILLVLLPFIAGLAARQIFSLAPDHLLLQYLPSVCIILAVWMSLSASSDVFAQLNLLDFGRILAATLLLHFGLMALGALAGRLLRTPREGQVALLLISSQKTLPVAISVLAAIGPDLGEAVLVCVLFHFIQLLADSLMLPLLKRAYPAT